MDRIKLEQRFKLAEKYMDDPAISTSEKEKAIPKFRELVRMYSELVYN